MSIKSGNTIKAANYNPLGDFVANESITEGDAVALTIAGWDTLELDQIVNDTQKNIKTTWYAQSFVVPADATGLTEMKLKINVKSNDYTYFKIKTGITGSPTTLYSAQLAENTNGVRTFTMAVDMSAYQGQTLYIIAGCGANNVDHYIYTDSGAAYGAGTTYSASSETGTYTALGSQESFYFEFTFSGGEADRVVQASAAAFNSRLNFVGFAMADAAAAEAVQIDWQTITDSHGLTLTDGAEYFLSDTAGAIATSAGTIERVIGVARSTSRLIRSRGIVSAPFSISANQYAPTQGIMFSDAGSTTDQYSVDGVNAKADRGMSRAVRRGAYFNKAGYFNILDFGGYN